MGEENYDFLGLIGSAKKVESPNSDSPDNKISQNQFYDLIVSEEFSWQAIIYDLVRTEQLDPWDIDLIILAKRYQEVIEKMEETEFHVSSKVLLACALLLRLKSEMLLNKFIPGLDELLYGKQDEKRYELERIFIDENELPILVPRTPMPRNRKVTLNELMGALNKAIETENRRIRREIRQKRAEKSALVVMPTNNKMPLKSLIKLVFQKISAFLDGTNSIKMKYHELAPTREERISSFLPVLHLTNNDKLYLEQPEHFGDIHMMFDRTLLKTHTSDELEKELTSTSTSEDDWKKAEIEDEDDLGEDDAGKLKAKAYDIAEDLLGVESDEPSEEASVSETLGVSEVKVEGEEVMEVESSPVKEELDDEAQFEEFGKE